MESISVKRGKDHPAVKQYIEMLKSMVQLSWE